MRFSWKVNEWTMHGKIFTIRLVFQQKTVFGIGWKARKLLPRDYTRLFIRLDRPWKMERGGILKVNPLWWISDGVCLYSIEQILSCLLIWISSPHTSLVTVIVQRNHNTAQNEKWLYPLKSWTKEKQRWTQKRKKKRKTVMWRPSWPISRQTLRIAEKAVKKKK